MYQAINSAMDIVLSKDSNSGNLFGTNGFSGQPKI